MSINKLEKVQERALGFINNDCSSSPACYYTFVCQSNIPTAGLQNFFKIGGPK